ncbi:MAG: type II toxin-antitoxin system VapC family toxin [Terriglobales bacterium]
MSRIFWDTNIFVYLFEGSDERAERARQLRTAMLRRGDQLLTSALALAELLVKPVERGDEAICTRYEQAVQNTAIVLPFAPEQARTFAQLRSGRIRPPDAVHLACAATAGVDLFVTSDARLQSVRVAGIQFIVPLERVPL